MLYRIEKRDSKFCILKEGVADPLGSYDNKAEANAQLATLYAKVQEAITGRLLAPIVEEAEGKAGAKWTVCVIQEGMSGNRTLYPAAVLQDAAKLYEGARVFWNHTKGDGSMRDPRDIAGFLRSSKFSTIETAAGPRGAILAVLHATDKGLRERLMEAHEAGNPDLFGLSHTASAEAERVRMPDGPAMKVNRIRAVESVDVVSFPSAGGRVLRLVAGLSSPVPVTQEDFVMFEAKLKKLRESYPALAARLSASPTEDEVDKLLLEALGVAPAPAAAAKEPEKKPDAPASQGLSEADKQLLHESRVDRALIGRTLPAPVLTMLREGLYARVGASPEEIKAEVDRTVTMATKLQEGMKGSGLGNTMEMGADEADKLIEGLDGFFAQSLQADGPKHLTELRGGKPAKNSFRSFREAYSQITGDREVTGRIQEAKGLGRFTRLQEGMTTGSWAEILGDSVRRAMLADYRTINYLDDWRKIVSDITSPPDFRTNRRLRLAGYGDLSTVGEAQPYPALASPGDEEATYSVSKRGGTETITMEMIINDDVGAIRRIPTNLARAAKRTLYKSVLNLLRDNSLIYDGVALAAAGHGNNISAGALSTTEASAATRVMQEQTAFGVADEPLNLFPRTLLVPAELRELGWRLTSIQVQPVSGQNATEPNYIRSEVGLNQLIVVPYWTDANNWWLVGDVMDIPTIEVGFLQGRQEPEVFVQDNPSLGSMFAADKLDYKIRLIWGLAVLDFRGFFGGIV